MVFSCEFPINVGISMWSLMFTRSQWHSFILDPTSKDLSLLQVMIIFWILEMGNICRMSPSLKFTRDLTPVDWAAITLFCPESLKPQEVVSPKEATLIFLDSLDSSGPYPSSSTTLHNLESICECSVAHLAKISGQLSLHQSGYFMLQPRKKV